jgi:hypothetical protein
MHLARASRAFASGTAMLMAPHMLISFVLVGLAPSLALEYNFDLIFLASP